MIDGAVPVKAPYRGVPRPKHSGGGEPLINGEADAATMRHCATETGAGKSPKSS
jgi:hypothetical protein